MRFGKNFEHGVRARARTKAGTDIWYVGLSVCGLPIGIKRSNGCKVGMTSIQDLFWNEMYTVNGTREIEESGNEQKKYG